MKKMLFTGAALLALTSCGKSAQSSMESFCGDMSAGKWQQAFATFGDAETMKAALADFEEEPETKQMAEALFGNSKCSVTASKEDIITVDVDAVNALAVTGQVMADSMGMAFMAAFGGAGSEEMMQEAMVGKMLAGLTADDAPRTKATVDVAMHQVQGLGWPQKLDSFE